MSGLIIFLFFFIVIILVINCIVASKFQDIAIQKGYEDSSHAFVMCLFFGIIGYLYVIALPDLNMRRIISKSNISKAVTGNDSAVQADIIDTNPCNETNEEKMYKLLVEKAEKFKDTFYDRDYRIRTYESIIKNMEFLANKNYKDSTEKLQEYTNYLNLLKAQKIK